MLILSRKKSETIMIGDDIRIMVTEIRPERVRIGVQAPADVPVHRGEVYRAIKRKSGTDGERKESGTSAGMDAPPSILDQTPPIDVSPAEFDKWLGNPNG